MSTLIFSRPIHSGKTTGLLHWSEQQENILGVLMPDINGSRKVLDLSTRTVFDIQCTDPANTTEPLTTVGRFHFYDSSFERANRILLEAFGQNPDWLIIDEAGKLELDSKGFYPAIKAAVDIYNDKKNTGTLLITVRDSLCEEVIRFFGLNDCRIVHEINDLHK